MGATNAQPRHYLLQSLDQRQQLSLQLVKRTMQIGGFAFWRTETGDLIMGNGYGEAMQLGSTGEGRLIKLLADYFNREF